MDAKNTSVRPSLGHDYYHNLTTWLSFDLVRRSLNEAVSGCPDTSWMSFLAANYPTSTSCLSINCGNGWVEQALFKQAVIRTATGTDVDARALEAAKQGAERIGMSAAYIEHDINADLLPCLGFDFVLNHASLHHVARVDYVVRQICELLPDDGLFVSFDYTGPHRNQYPYEIWSPMAEFNARQPSHLQNAKLIYPHLPTMLALDPSEAIHSELLLEHFKRYFFFEKCVALGGCFAYQLMHDHANLNTHKDTSEGRALVAEILRIDNEMTCGDPYRSFFTFIIMRPNKSALANKAQLDLWTSQENAREQLALTNGGTYYPKTALQIITQDLAMARYRLGLVQPGS